MLINFMRQFVDPIRMGTKKHTLRAPRKDGQVPRVGEVLDLYTGLRRPGAERILNPPPRCSRVDSVVLRLVGGRGMDGFEIWLGALLEDDASPVQRGACLHYPEQFGMAKLGPDEVRRFAESDGFATVEDFWAHWVKQGLPRYLHLIVWEGADRC